jgi:chromosome segregation ATPase
LSLDISGGSAIVGEDEKSMSSKGSKKSTGSITKKKATGTKKGTKAADGSETSKPQSPSALESAVPEKIGSPKNPGNKKKLYKGFEELLSVIPKFPKKPAVDKRKSDLLEGLRKTRAAITSIGVLSQKPDLNKQGAAALKKQLDEAVAQIETLQEVIEMTSSEVADFTGMLSESAKENNELTNQLEQTQASMIENDNKIEEFTKEVEELGEEKKALAFNLLRSDDDLKSLISQMKLMEQGSMGGGAQMSEVFELQKSVNDKELKIDEQAKELDERDAKIIALERQLASDGGVCETQEIDKVNAELGSLKKKHKTDQLESSVQLAKKDAMIASLQNQLDQAKEGNEQEAQVSSSLREELENSKEKLREVLLRVEEGKTNQKKVEELEQRVQDAETVEKGLQDAIDKWTDKTFEWKEKAEGLEMELNQLRSGDAYADGASRGSEPSQPGLWGVFGA